MVVKLTSLAVLIVAVGHWLRGHDVLTGMALILLSLLVLAKMVGALISKSQAGHRIVATDNAHRMHRSRGRHRDARLYCQRQPR
jgi:hypothetical protein